MYSNKFAVALRVNERVLRELDDVVRIPFGSEYDVRLKNLNTVKALVNVSIDGTDVTEGGLVLHANQTLDLERSIVNGNLDKGNKFKFIERTSRVEQHRGVGVEDGLIRVEYQFEKPPVYMPYQPNWYNAYRTDCVGGQWDDGLYQTKGLLRGLNNAQVTNTISSSNLEGARCFDSSVAYACAASAAPSAGENVYLAQNAVNEAGITVAGSISDQKFVEASWFQTESQKHVIVLKIIGMLDNGKPVIAPVTVKQKQKCNTCGHVNKATAKFCSECGSGLEIIR